MLTLTILLGTALSVKVAFCEGTEVLVEAGFMAMLPCRIGTTARAVTVQWNNVQKRAESTVWRMEKSGMEFRGMGVGQKSGCSHVNIAKGDFSLLINNVKEEDGGEYVCRVIGQNLNVVKRVILRVIKVTLSANQPVEGSNVKLTCDVSPWSEEVTVSWRLNGRPFLQQSQRQGSRKSFREQYISSVTQNENGVWMCVVSLRGQQRHAKQVLTVKGISNPANELTTVYAEVGSPVRLPCVYTAGVTPQRPVWERVREGVGPSQSLSRLFQASPFSSHSPWDQSAHLETVKAEDGGMYKCSGTVEGRRVARQLQLVTAQVLSETAVKQASLTLTCHLSDAADVTGYQWVRVTHDFNVSHVEILAHHQKTLKIEQTKEGNAAEWACRYSGRHGILGNATYHAYEMSPQKSKKESKPLSVATVTGLGFLCLVLLLVALQMYRNYRRRKMALQYPALETIVHAISNAQERMERNRSNEKGHMQNQQMTV